MSNNKSVRIDSEANTAFIALADTHKGEDETGAAFASRVMLAGVAALKSAAKSAEKRAEAKREAAQRLAESLEPGGQVVIKARGRRARAEATVLSILAERGEAVLSRNGDAVTVVMPLTALAAVGSAESEEE